MLDKGNRIALGKELLRAGNLNVPQRVYIYYEPEHKRLVLKKDNSFGNLYFVKDQNIDEKGRIVIPTPVRNVFPEAKYLPVAMYGEIYILII